MDDVLSLTPPLDPSEVAFLAGFSAAPVRDHAGAVVVDRVLDGVPARVWPGQPRAVAPVGPCATGCCLVPRPRRGGELPGVTAQWLRFLLRTFLTARHRVDGELAVPLRDGRTEILTVEDGELLEGVLDPPDGPLGGWPA